MTVEFSLDLLRWYDAHWRVLPWRAGPGEQAEPYRVWLSEIMLQQTNVTAVRPYFERFTARWPSLQALAAAEDGELMSAWAGLGYYARARNLLACARRVVADFGGHFPDSEAELVKLPGIGRYTAAAVAAIAFGHRAVVVDGNVERVVSRVHAVETPLPAARPELYRLADALTPGKRVGDHAQAMMDLGATICTPRAPRCPACPVSSHCRAFQRGRPEDYPRKAARKPKPQRHGRAYWLEHEGAVLLVRRPERGLLGGMLALPTGSWSAEPVEDGAPIAAEWQAAGAIDHVFTHFALTLHVSVASAAERLPHGIWWPVTSLDEAGLPTVFAKAAARAVEWRNALPSPACGRGARLGERSEPSRSGEGLHARVARGFAARPSPSRPTSQGGPLPLPHAGEGS